MIRDGTVSELGSIRELLIAANDYPYDIGIVADEKVFGRGVSGAPHVRVFEDRIAIRGVAVTCGRYLRILAVDREHRGRGIGTALLDDSGATVIAAEPGNYFTPGVLDPAFFLKRGYREIGRTWNLHAEIRDSYESRISNPESRISMLTFIERHFGAAWRFEAERAAIAHYVPDVGFAVAEANNKGLGTFGPMGIARKHRGRGVGRQLLLACLADLRRLGYTRAVIPWAASIDFYRRACGAEPAHELVALGKSL